MSRGYSDVDALTDSGKGSREFLGKLELLPVPLLPKIGNVRGPDVLADVTELVDPVADPHEIVIMNDRLPFAGRNRSLLGKVEHNILRAGSRLPSSPHGMASATHEETRRFCHPVCNLGPDSVNVCITILLLQLESEFFPLNGEFLLDDRVTLLLFLAQLILVDRSPIDLGIFDASIF